MTKRTRTHHDGRAGMDLSLCDLEIRTWASRITDTGVQSYQNCSFEASITCLDSGELSMRNVGCMFQTCTIQCREGRAWGGDSGTQYGCTATRCSPRLRTPFTTMPGRSTDSVCHGLLLPTAAPLQPRARTSSSSVRRDPHQGTPCTVTCLLAAAKSSFLSTDRCTLRAVCTNNPG